MIKHFFVGDNSSLSLIASSLNGIKPNCIYFIDDDLRVFNCEKASGYKYRSFPSLDELKRGGLLRYCLSS